MLNKLWPQITNTDTHHLVSARYRVPRAEILSELWDSSEEANDLISLSNVTNRLDTAKHELLPGIGIHELVFGVPYSDVINAAFTHTSPFGSRFNASDRGAWYAALSTVDTAIEEVAYHKSQQLLQTGWTGSDTSVYDDFIADLSGVYARVSKGDETHSELLLPGPIPECYAASQRFAADLLRQGVSGVVYPSVRKPDGWCVVCFRPALVSNVRTGESVRLEVAADGVAFWEHCEN